ncbi:hypothetical protein ACFVIM_23050 [Streptomyces sp. NPDC057638]|uniref:hypothetical protein n=1 Tax=Streptomyces sp. NPDC057638 TaxID=3346190 RepID=UPI00367AC842
MSVARRPLLTAIVAGILLCALWLVPSADATTERTSARDSPAITAAREARTVGSTPYAIGAMAFFALGVAFVAYAVRERIPVRP